MHTHPTKNRIMKALEAKVVVLGSQGVGKTSIIEQFITKLHSKEIAPTIGATFFICKLIMDEIKVNMQVWDTAGQERFRAMAPMYYRNANAALLVFDISAYSTFADVKVWVQELQKNVQEPMTLIVVGNKNDLSNQRAVSREEAYLFATSIGGNYLETSTVNEQGIEHVFNATALGLIRLSELRGCHSLKRYDSIESVSDFFDGDSPTEHLGVVHLGEAADAANYEATGIGRLETPAWSINHIAHGYEQKSGWCCY